MTARAAVAPSSYAVAGLVLSLGCLAASAPAVAEDFIFEPAVTEACLSDGTFDRSDCIGAAAGMCMERNEGGETTVGMGACLSREFEWWDARLNDAFVRLMPLHEATDAEMADIGATVPGLADSLLAMQRAWIVWRDAACAYEYAQWGGGTGGGPSATACMMRLTAEQALALEDRIDLWSGP